MRHLRAVLSRIAGLFAGQRADADVDAELQAHLEMHTAENIRRGMDPSAARREAILASGGLTVAAEAVREQRGLPLIENVVADVRYALRALSHSPAYTFVAVITLALGIGANTAIFSVVNGVVLQPLPYLEPERLVSVASVVKGVNAAVSARDFMDWRAEARSFAGLAASYSSSTILTGSGDPEQLAQARVTANVMDVLSLRPILGRPFLPGEDEVAAPRVAILSEGFWRRRFGGDTSIVGRSLRFDGFPTMVVGIAPAAMRWPQPVDVWLTTRFSERDLAENSRGERSITVLARLAPGASLESARAEMTVMAWRLAQRAPAYNENVGTSVTPLLANMIADVRTPLFVLLGVVGFVLLIACANVGSLTLARVAARDAELAVRTALGASRGRIARQVLTESLLVALLGGALGLSLATWVMNPLVALAPADLPRAVDIKLDGRVLAFTFLVTTVTGLLFGLAPALHGSAADLHDRLRATGRGAFGRKASARTRRVLVVGEVALAIVLLAGAGLLLRSFAQLNAVDPGFNPEGVSTFALGQLPSRYKGGEGEIEFAARLLEGIRRIPGVSAAAVSFNLPLNGTGSPVMFEVKRRPKPDAGSEPTAQARAVSAEYFATMRIPLIRGRTFDARDRLGSPQVLVISAEVARRYFSDTDPIGEYIETSWGGSGWGGRRFGGEVVGVVGDVRQEALDQSRTAHLYMSYDQWPVNEFDVVISSTAPHASVLTAARSTLKQLDDEIPMNDARAYDDIVAGSLGDRRFYLTLLGVFASLAMVLALVGIYGVIAYGVQQRRREIGIRLALGATEQRVLQMVLSDGLRLVVVGVALGVLAAAGLTRLLEKLLYEVGPRDPVTFAAVPLALIVAAAVACVLPARSAARLNPADTIRAE